MSWSNFSFDIFTPSISGTLTTQTLQIDNLSKNSAIGTCNTACQCDPDPPICFKNGTPLCIPTFQNTCGSGITMIATSNETPVFLSYSDNGCPHCCSAGVCKDQSHFASCQTTQNQYCGNLNGKTTCTLGEYGIGNCPGGMCSSTGPNLNWSPSPGVLPTNSNMPGWIICEYSYDFSSFWQATYNQFSYFVLDIISQKSSPGAPSGMDKSVLTRIRDSNLVYACIYDFYNRLFNTGYYFNNPAMNPLNTIDFISSGFVSTVSDIVQTLENYIFINQSIPPSLDQSIRNSLIPPQAIQNGDSYSLSIQLSYSQYQQYLASGNPNGYLENCINAFLKDSQGKMTNNGINIPIAPLVLTNATVVSISAIQLVDSNGNPLYSYKTNIKPADFTVSNYSGYIFATAQIIANIENWSPMLLIYCINTLSTISFSPNTCALIATQINTIPSKCYDTCSSSGSSCLDYIEKFCSINYQIPSQFNQGLADNSLLSLNDPDCLCYNSYLTPAGQGFQQGVPASMCFDTHCSDSFRAKLGITDQQCPQYCDEVWDWYNGSGQDKSRRPDFLDQTRYAQLCGKMPTMQPAQINSSILVTGIITTILGGLLTFSIAKHSKLSSMKTFLFIVLIILILGSLTAFFSRDLAGISKGCSGDKAPYKFICESRITKINLPNQFCNFQEACECVGRTGDCPNGCQCASTVCLPSSGKRPYTTIRKTRPNPILITLGCIVGIILPSILIYLHEDYHWPISKTKFSIIMILIGIACLGYTAYSATRKFEELVFDGPCSGTGPMPSPTGCNPPCPTGYVCNPNNNQCDCIENPCNNRQCGFDGCGNPCPPGGSGLCPNGYACREGQCVSPASFEIGYTDSKGITYNLGVMVNSSGLISPQTLFLYPTQQILANPNGFYTNWTYDPSSNILYLTPNNETGQNIYALTTMAPSNSICDPYPNTNNPGNWIRTSTADYPMYVDLYEKGSSRFERWEIHTDGKICDTSCKDNNGNNRCIASYSLLDTNGNPIPNILSPVTSSPWNLECSIFTFEPNPPAGVFYNTPSCDSVLVCNDRTGNEDGCPQITVTTGNNKGPVTSIGCTGLQLKSQPNPLWGPIQNEEGVGVCGVTPFNQQYQQGCCAYIGDACFSNNMNTWCNQLAFPYQ